MDGGGIIVIVVTASGVAGIVVTTASGVAGTASGVAGIKLHLLVVM